MKNIRNYYILQIAVTILPGMVWVVPRLLSDPLANQDSVNLMFNVTILLFFIQILVLLQYISLNKFLNELQLKKNFLRINGLIAVLFTSAVLIFQVIGLFDYITGNCEASISHDFQPVRSTHLLSNFIFLFAAHTVFTLIFTAFSMKSLYRKKSADEKIKLKYKKYGIPAMIQAWMPLVLLLIFLIVTIINDFKKLL
jgi:hypothetical protein